MKQNGIDDRRRDMPGESGLARNLRVVCKKYWNEAGLVSLQSGTAQGGLVDSREIEKRTFQLVNIGIWLYF